MKLLLRLFLLLLLVLGLSSAAVWTWLSSPLDFQGPEQEFTIEPGGTSRSAVQAIVSSGVNVSALALTQYFRWSGQARDIKAGTYALKTGDTPQDLLRKLVTGEQALGQVTVVEGWTFKQMRAALLKSPRLSHDSAGMSDAEIMATLKRPGVHPEGRFFPSTYSYPRGSSDFKVWQQALDEMDKRLAQAWAQKAADTPLGSPEELLIMASIVEKETGRKQDRGLISAVFNNRLRIGMMLQTDPTVIYGLGAGFDGDLRRKDLKTDNPYNTYTREGLPPTPIALPSWPALLAAAKPDASKALYFVAKGDGSSYFSSSLDEHNRAVNYYQRKIGSPP